MVVVAGLAITAMLEQEWPAFGRAIAGGFVLAFIYAALATAFPEVHGLGDVKLALVLGTAMAWVGWGAGGGGFGASLLGRYGRVASMATGRAGRKSALPFGPFMVVAAIGAMAWGSAGGHVVLQSVPLTILDSTKRGIADATGGLGSTEVTVAKEQCGAEVGSSTVRLATVSRSRSGLGDRAP